MTALLDHLWQSSLVALGVGLLTLAFRNNAARIRFWLWFAASLKFLVPFALLVLLGEKLARLMPAPLPPALRGLAPAAERLSAPAQLLAPAHGAGLALPLLLLWAAGFCAVLGTALLRGLKLRALLRKAEAVPLAAPVEVRVTQSLLEPGLVGIFRPVVLLPRDLLAGLSPAERDGILAHEITHLKRRDNLTAALHMTVEALFWFWPPVWLIGARLIAERERACDEGVIAAGHDPETYAGGILKVCRFCIRSPLACAAGVSGANLSSRIRQIMSAQQAIRLDDGRRMLLAGAAMMALGLPVAAGLVTTPLAVAVTQHVAAARARATQAVVAVAEEMGVTMPAAPVIRVRVRPLPRPQMIALATPPVAAPAEPAAPQLTPVIDSPSPALQSQLQVAPAAPTKQAVLAPAKQIALALDPRGEGDPDAVTCRAPQALPGSRLPGPEVCQPNRFWASLYSEHRTLAPDGRTLIATNERYGAEALACPVALLQAVGGAGASSSFLRACR